MPSPNSANSLRAAQILLSDVDRQLQSRLQERFNRLDCKSVGPTALSRAGLIAMNRLDEEALLKLIDEIQSRPTLETILKKFDNWCSKIAIEVRRVAPQLANVHESAQPGIFSHEGRFVAITVAPEGRCLVTGVQIVTKGLAPRVERKPSPKLFPGVLAAPLSMDEAGLRLAVRAVVAWLTSDEKPLPAIRSEFQKHTATPLR